MADKLPKDIVYRRKKGFGIPLAAWLMNDLKVICNDVLSRDSITSGGIFNWQYVQELKNQHFNGKANNYKQLWTLMVFQMWMDRWGK